MRSYLLRLAGLALALGAAAAAPPAGAQSAAPADVRTKTLDNGLEVLVLSNPASAFVTVQMVLRAGAQVQLESDDAGHAHLVEHLLFRRGDAGSFDSDLSKIEASWNGITDKESVTYFFTFPSKFLTDGVDLMGRMIRRPSFTKGALDAERAIVKGELERNASEPDFHLYVESEAALWGDQAWTSRSPGGNVVALQSASIEKLQKLYQRYYVPNNAALIVAGNVKADEVFALAEKTFGNWKKGPDPFEAGRAPPIKPLAGPMRKVITGDVKDVTILIRWHGPSTETEADATYAADVFAGLVNQPLSRAKKRLLDGGLVDDLSMSYETLGRVGPIALSIRTSEDRAAAAARTIGEEVAAMTRPDFFTDDDLALARKWQEVGSHFRVESASVAAGVLASFWTAGGAAYYTGYNAGLDKQTPDDLRRFQSAYLSGKPYSVVVMIPRFSPPQLRAAIEQALTRWSIK